MSVHTARQAVRTKATEAARMTLGNDAAEALTAFYEPYNEALYTWFAGLWDREIGGFYYSNSARDTEGYLPDIESTVQAMRCLSSIGLYEGRGGLYAGTPAPMREAILRFTRSLQDKEDGYFYHPQWGKDITVSRRGRDLSWSVGILKDFHAEALYPTPLDRVAQGVQGSTLPPYLCSLSAFREYLSAAEEASSPYYIRTSSYPLGNLLQSQAIQIRAAGEEFVAEMFAWLERLQLSNGLWEQTCSYASVNGLMKITLLYSTFGRTIPHIGEALSRAIETVCSPVPCGACVLVYNPWVVISNLMGMLKNGKDEKTHAEFSKYLTKNAAEMIFATANKVQRFRKADGSYSYCPDHSSATSQGAKVALPNMNEGDVNATSILSNGTPRSMCSALGISQIPLFCREDGESFFSLLNNKK